MCASVGVGWRRRSEVVGSRRRRAGDAFAATDGRLTTNLIGTSAPQALVEFFGTLSAEWAMDCLKELLVSNPQVGARSDAFVCLPLSVYPPSCTCTWWIILLNPKPSPSAIPPNPHPPPPNSKTSSSSSTSPRSTPSSWAPTRSSSCWSRRTTGTGSTSTWGRASRSGGGRRWIGMFLAWIESPVWGQGV